MKLLVATLFLSGVFSAPFNTLLSRPESTECNRDSSRFHSRKTMVFEYEGETTSGLVGTSKERTGLKLRATCEIIPVTPCVHKLKITEAELLESQGKNHKSLVYEVSSGNLELRRELLARDLYFESAAGTIGNLRMETGEPMHILNMKRGILSAFQLKLVKNDETVTEVDVAGECGTKYHVTSRHPNGRVKKMVKTKNLSQCKDRSMTNLGIPTTPYPTDKPFSLLNSKSACTYLVSSKRRLGQVQCKETHLFRPFSSGYNKTAGAMTTIRQFLKLIGHRPHALGAVTLPETEMSSLKYEHSRKEEKMTKNDREVGTILEKLGQDVQPDSAKLFTKLIFAVRRLNMKALKSVWFRHHDCLEHNRCTKSQSEKYQTYIVDALSQCGTLECAQYMVNMISEKKVGTQQSIAFLTGIALVGRPSEDMVGNILFFCQETPSRTAFLTLGTLMHKFCTQHDCSNLNTRSSIYQAENFLRGKLRHDCVVSTPEETNSVTLALKAIGNAGRPVSAVQHILKCALQPGSTAINIEALQALRRVSCSTEMTDGLMNIFKSLVVDTEIRIETYLALMRCPTDKVINDIADVLDNEKNNQVGSFVWSHMTNALESTEPVYGVPLRNIIANALGERKLRTYNRNHLRFSHAYETSYYNYKQEVGGSSQAQLIFHPSSYFPRSAMFNLTVDIFGASINLLETAARFEGFESLIEQMFGADGYFPDERIMKMLKEKPNNGHRNPRSTNEIETDEIKHNLEKLHDKIKIDKKTPSGGLSFKLFGHELQFISFDDIDWLQGEADSINVIDTLINLARGGQVTYVKSFMFLEADHEVPTGLGMPLKLAVNGSAVSSLNLKGKFDIRNMFWGKKKLDIRGIVSPSTVIDISGKMSIDAKHASSGLRMNTSLYTATEINGNATFKEGEGIKLSIEPPKKPVYVVNVTSNLATYLNRKTQKISGAQPRFERQTCANISRLLGVKLCGHVSSPMPFSNLNAPYSPLNGDSSFGLSYETTNAKLARFELVGRTLKSKDDNRYDWIFSMHVPGLTFGRKIDANSTFQFLREGKYLSVSCGIHDYKFGKFEATYNNVTNGLHTKFSTPQMSYLKPVTIESEVFNITNPLTMTKNFGVVMNATYNNFTIQEVMTVFKQKDHYGFRSNLTYWPLKHITTEARLSLVRKSAYFKVHDTGSKSHLFFVGRSGKTDNKFYFKVGNDALNYELKSEGAGNIAAKTFRMEMFTKPTGDMMTFELYPRESSSESGFYMSMVHVNSSSTLAGHIRSFKSPTKKALKFSGMAMDRPFYIHIARNMLNNRNDVELVARGFGNSANASLGFVRESHSVGIEYNAALNGKSMTSRLDLFKEPSKIGFNLNATIIKQTYGLLGEYFRKDANSGLHMRLTGADKTLDTTTSYFATNSERGLNFTVKGMDRTASVVAAYYEQEHETGVKLNGSFADKSMEIRASVLENRVVTRFGGLSDNRLRFVVNAMDNNLQIDSELSSKNDGKEWRVDGVYNGRATTFLSKYTDLATTKSLCSEMFDADKTYYKLCSQYIRNEDEHAIDLSAEVMGRKAEVRTSLVHTDSKRGGQIKVKYNNAVMSDVFLGMVTTPSYKGLNFRGTVKDKTVDALLMYRVTPLAPVIELQLHIQGRQVSFETQLLRQPQLKGIQMNVAYQNAYYGTVYALVETTRGARSFRIGAKTASNNGIEYKLSMTNSRLEKTISSITTVTANAKPYKYGGSITFSNHSTKGHINHRLTTKLHYSRNKALTSTLHFENSNHILKLHSKMELAPGQHVNHKLKYFKRDSKILAQFELLPDFGMTYEAGVIRESDLVKLTSNLTVFDYPMESSMILDKGTQELSVKIKYCPVRPPIEINTHLRTVAGIDTGLVLSAFDKTWRNTFLVDYAAKRMEMSFDVLPEVPIRIFGRMLDNELTFNLSTCSAFSLQVVGSKLAEDAYQLTVGHQYLENLFEDLKLTVNSLNDLRKLNVRWNASTVTELLRSLNVSMQDFLVNTLELLTDKAELAKEKTMEFVKYLRSDGKELLMKMLENYKERLNTIKVQLKALRVDDWIERSSSYAAIVLEKAKTNLKDYETRLSERYRQIEKIVREMVSEMLPQLRTLRADTGMWLSRSLHRYRALEICGQTVGEMADGVTERAREIMVMFLEKWKEQSEMLSERMKDMVLAVDKLQGLLVRVRMNIEEFTCDYDMTCTANKVKRHLNNIADKMPEIHEQLKERLEKIREDVLERYTTMEKRISRTITDKKLRERAEKLLQPIIDFIKTVRATMERQIRPLQEKLQDLVKRFEKCPLMIYYRKMKFHSNELVKDCKEAIARLETGVQEGKEQLRVRMQELQHHLETIRTKSLEMYKKLSAKMEEVKTMSVDDMREFVKKEMKVNYEEVRRELLSLLETMKTRINECQEQHSREIERMKVIGRKIHSSVMDVVEGRITVEQLQDWLREVTEEVRVKLATLKLKENTEKLRTRLVSMYNVNSEDLRMRVPRVYAKAVTDLKRLVEKVKVILKGYIDLTMTKISELREQQSIRLDAAVMKLNQLKTEIMKKIQEFVDQYKNMNMDNLKEIMAEGRKMMKSYESMLKEAFVEYKHQLKTKALEKYNKTRQDIMEVVELYKDMPVRDIIDDLRLKAGEKVETTLGFVLGTAIAAYDTATVNARKLKQFYEDARKVCKTRCEEILRVVREMNTEWRAMAEKQYQMMTEYIDENISFELLEKIRDRVKTFVETRYEQIEAFYGRVKHMKFKEFYFKARELLTELDSRIKESRENMEENLSMWTVKVKQVIQETRDECGNVASRISNINSEIWEDAVTTFRPYKARLTEKTDALKVRYNTALNRLSPQYQKLRSFATELKGTVEEKINKFDGKKMVNDISRSLRRCPVYTMTMEWYTLITDERTMTNVRESLLRCPFINGVRTHPLWPALKQEFLDHEFVAASQELKSSMKQLSSEYYSTSITKLDRLKGKIDTETTRLKQRLLDQNEEVKKQLQEKREELRLRYHDTHRELKERWEDVRRMYDSLEKSFTSNLKMLGDMSLYDVQQHLKRSVEKHLEPAKSAYNEVSDYVREQARMLREKRQDILHRFDDLRKKADRLAETTKEWYKELSRDARKQANATLIIAMSQAEKVEQVITKMTSMYQEFVGKYLAYNDLLRMTPNEILMRLKEIPYREQFDSLKLRAETAIESFGAILRDADENLRSVAGAIVETGMFMNRFYLGETTLYSRRPELLEFAENRYRMAMNYSTDWRKKVMEYLDQSYDLLRNELNKTFPKVVEYVRSKIEDVKTKIEQMDMQSLKMLMKIIDDYITEYSIVFSEKFQTVRKEAGKMYKENLKRFEELRNMGHVKYREMSMRVNEEYLKMSNSINTELLTGQSLENARRRMMNIWTTITRDLETLVDDISENIQRTVQTIRNRVTRSFSSYENDLQRMKNIVDEVMGIARSIVRVVQEINNRHSPRMQRRVKELVEATRQMDWNNTDTISRAADALYEVSDCARDALKEQYRDSVTLIDQMMKDVRPKILNLYEINLGKVQTLLELCKDDLKVTWTRIERDLQRFYDIKKRSMLESTAKIRGSVSDYMTNVHRVGKENMDMCVETATFYYEKSKDAFEDLREVNVEEVVRKYKKILFDEYEQLVNKVKERVHEMIGQIEREMGRMRQQAMDMNTDIMRAVREGRIRAGRWIDMQDLMNKTMEIKEDLYKFNPIQELVHFKERFDIEYSKAVGLLKDNTEFAVYIFEHVFKYNDIWDIVDKLTSPFFWIPPSNSTGMIFGRAHVYTFDGQYYKFVGYKKPDCTYVLAKDVRDDSFTLLSQEKSLIIKTKVGTIKVHASGKVQTTVYRDGEGNRVNVKYDNLPVQLKNATVIRDGDFVKINHVTGLQIACDIKHFYCTFNIDKFYHGRLAGLLGTNNNEQYDRLMKPDKTFAKSEIEFANAWEVSGDPQCQVQDETEVEVPCRKRPSHRCEELFLKSSSPLATHFKYLDPKPFYEACLTDTSDCSVDTPSVCNVTAAYTALLKERGIWAHQISECVSCWTKTLWYQRANKSVDVVLLIPETRDLHAHIISLPGILRDLDRDIRAKYTPRYALVGFGGKTGLHQGAHVVTAGTEVFGDIDTTIKALQHMTFTSKKADALDTIDYLSRMPFRSGASKIVFLLTGQYRNATSSKCMASATRDLNMQGIIFNVIGPYFQKKYVKTFGQSKHGVRSLAFDDYTRLAESSQGGIFNLKAISPGQSSSMLKKAMKTTLIKQIMDDQKQPRTCVCLASMASQPEFMCTKSRHRRNS